MINATEEKYGKLWEHIVRAYEEVTLSRDPENEEEWSYLYSQYILNRSYYCAKNLILKSNEQGILGPEVSVCLTLHLYRWLQGF